jgi:ABC-type transporter Mla subunit MlaD
VQGKFYVSFIKSLLPENYNGINLQEITSVLSISSILASVATEIPDLLLGYNSLIAGFERTFGVLSTTDLGGGFGSSTSEISADYNPEFNIGLDNISTAIDHFNNSKQGVTDALEEAQELIATLIVDETADLATTLGIVDEAKVGYGLILEIALGAIEFLNATYKTTLAIEDLGDSAFSGSADWLRSASGDLEDANSTFQEINTTGLDPNSILPFYGTVEILKDMTNLLTYFSYAATNGTECYDKMDDVLVAIDALNFNSTNLAAITAGLNALTASVTETSSLFTDAAHFIDVAANLAEGFETKTYGDTIDSAFKPILSDFSSMLDTFSDNITQMAQLVTALDHTVLSIDSFTTGFTLFNTTYTEAYNGAGGNFATFFSTLMNDPRFNRSEELMDFSLENASMGHYYVGQAQAISGDVKNTWQSLLYSPTSPPPPPAPGLSSIAGLAYAALEQISLLRTVADLTTAEGYAGLIQEFFESLETINLTDIFGGGGP